MKVFKKVMSLALALVMVVGALVVLPTEAKADALHTFTAAGNYELNLADYLTGYVDGDDVVVTVKLTSDSGFNGCIGINTGANWDAHEWKQTGQEGAAGTSTWTAEITEGLGNAQIQIWWMGGTSVTIDEITVTKKGEAPETPVEPDEPENDAIHTFVKGTEANKADGDFTIKASTYCKDFVEGKDYVITVKLSSDGYFNGIIGASSTSNYTWVPSAQQECAGGTATWTLEVTELYGDPLVQIWWMNDDCTYINIDEITVTAKTAAEPEQPDEIDPKGDVMAPAMVLFIGAALLVVGFVSKKKFA